MFLLKGRGPERQVPCEKGGRVFLGDSLWEFGRSSLSRFGNFGHGVFLIHGYLSTDRWTEQLFG